MVVGHQLRAEKVLRLLYVRDPRLPKQVQHVHAADAHVAQPVQLFVVPEHAVHGAPGLQLVPPRLGIRPPEPVVFQQHRQDTAQRLCLLPVSRLPGQHRRLRIAVHGVRVLAEDAVHQPAAGRPHVLRIAALARLLHLLPVPQLPELLVVDDAPVQILLARAIAPQHLRRGPYRLRPDLHRSTGVPRGPCLLLHPSTSLSCSVPAPAQPESCPQTCNAPNFLSQPSPKKKRKKRKPLRAFFFICS